MPTVNGSQVRGIVGQVAAVASIGPERVSDGYVSWIRPWPLSTVATEARGPAVPRAIGEQLVQTDGDPALTGVATTEAVLDRLTTERRLDDHHRLNAFATGVEPSAVMLARYAVGDLGHLAVEDV